MLVFRLMEKMFNSMTMGVRCEASIGSGRDAKSL